MTKPSLFPINNHPCHCNPTPSEPFGEWMKVRDQVSKLKGEFNKVTKQLADTSTELEERGIPIEKFGAKGDLITDDTQAFKNAISNVPDGSKIILSKDYLVKDPNSLTGSLPPKKRITFSGQGKFAKIKIKPNITNEVVNGNLTGLTYSVRDYYEEFAVSTLGWKVETIQLATGKIFEYIAIADKTQIPSTIVSGAYLRGKTSRVEFEVAGVDKNDPDGAGTARIYLFEGVNNEKGANLLEKDSSKVLTEDLQREIELGYSNTFVLDFGSSAIPGEFVTNRKLKQSNGKTARIAKTSIYTDQDGNIHNLVSVDSFSEWQDIDFYSEKPKPLDDNLNVEIKTYTVSSASFGSVNKCENVVFENIIFDGANYEVGLKHENGNGWNILYTYAAKNVTIRNCTFKNSIMGGLQIGNAGNSNAAIRDFPENVVVDNCYFENNGRGDIEVIRAKKVSITNCFGDGNFDIEANGDEILENILVSNCSFRGFTPYSPSSRTATSKISVINSVFQRVVSQVAGTFRMTNCFVHMFNAYNGVSSTVSNSSINRFSGVVGKYAVSFYNCDIYDLPRTGSGSTNEGLYDYMKFVGSTIDLSLVDNMTNNTFGLILISSKLISTTRLVTITRSHTTSTPSEFINSEVNNVTIFCGNNSGKITVIGGSLRVKDTSKLTKFIDGTGSYEILGCYIQTSLTLAGGSTGKVFDCVLDGESKPLFSAYQGLTINGLKSSLPQGIDWQWVMAPTSPDLLKFNNVSVSKNIPSNLGIKNGFQAPSVNNIAEGNTVFYMDDITKHASVMYNNEGTLALKHINYT